MIVWVVLACLIAIGAPLLWLYVVRMEARKAVLGAPRAQMFICDKHGALPISTTRVLFQGLEVERRPGESTKEDIRVCSICFEDKIRQARI